MLYFLLSVRMGIELWRDRRSVKKWSNRHAVMACVLAGCVVRLAYVDLVDFAAVSSEFGSAMRGLKEILCKYFVK